MHVSTQREIHIPYADDIADVQLHYLPTDSIEAGEDSRTLNHDFVASLARSIQEAGLVQPIAVRNAMDGRYVLLAGYHRLEAVKSIGSKIIAAYVVGAEATDDELFQLDENLFRKELSPAELAEAVGRRDLALQRIKKDNHLNIFPIFGENSDRERRVDCRIGGRGRKRNPNSDRAIAQVSGWSEETIRKSRKRVQALGLGVIADIKGTDLDSNSELDALCALAEVERIEKVAEAKRQASMSPSVRLRVSAKVAGRSSTPRQRLLRAWQGASDEDQEWFLRLIEGGDAC